MKKLTKILLPTVAVAATVGAPLMSMTSCNSLVNQVVCNMSTQAGIMGAKLFQSFKATTTDEVWIVAPYAIVSDKTIGKFAIYINVEMQLPIILHKGDFEIKNIYWSPKSNTPLEPGDYLVNEDGNYSIELNEEAWSMYGDKALVEIVLKLNKALPSFEDDAYWICAW